MLGVLAAFLVFAMLLVGVNAGWFASVFPLRSVVVQATDHGLSADIVVDFTVPITRAQAQRSLSIDGVEALVRPVGVFAPLGVSSQYALDPIMRLTPDTEYRVNTNTVQSMVGSVDRSSTHTVKTVSYPQLQSITWDAVDQEPQLVAASLEQGDQEVRPEDVVGKVSQPVLLPIDESIRAVLHGWSDDFSYDVDWRMRPHVPSYDDQGNLIEPQEAFVDVSVEATETIEGNQLILDPTTLWEQGMEYELVLNVMVKDDPRRSQQSTSRFITKPPVRVIGSSPNPGVTAAPIISPITLTFDRPVDQSDIHSFIVVSPESVTGTFTWENETTVSFVPDAFLPTDTKMEVKILPGLKSLVDQGSTKEQVIAFTTRPSGNGRPVPQPDRDPQQTEGRHIEVNLTKQVLYAYEDGALVNAFLVSTGLPGMRTPPGYYEIKEKKPVTTYQWWFGEGDSRNYYVPGVPWNMRLNNTHMFIHTAYWHSAFGQPMSRGCVNVNRPDAEWLYKEFVELGTPVYIYY